MQPACLELLHLFSVGIASSCRVESLSAGQLSPEQLSSSFLLWECVDASQLLLVSSLLEGTEDGSNDECCDCGSDDCCDCDTHDFLLQKKMFVRHWAGFLVCFPRRVSVISTVFSLSEWVSRLPVRGIQSRLALGVSLLSEKLLDFLHNLFRLFEEASE